MLQRATHRLNKSRPMRPSAELSSAALQSCDTCDLGSSSRPVRWLRVSGCSLAVEKNAGPKGKFYFDDNPSSSSHFTGHSRFYPICRETITTHLESVMYCNTARKRPTKPVQATNYECAEEERKVTLLGALISFLCFFGCLFSMVYFCLIVIRGSDPVHPEMHNGGPAVVLMRQQPPASMAYGAHGAAQPMGDGGGGEWQARIDPATGRLFEVNVLTQETRWPGAVAMHHGHAGNAVVATAVVAAPANGAPMAIPGVEGTWERVTDSGTGKAYEYNTVTRETRWL